MEILANIAAGFGAVLTPTTLALMLMGIVAGLLVGALPGLTAVMAVSLLIPITFGLDGVTALAVLLSVFMGSISGGFVSAILVNTPGTPSSIATSLDGYPLARQGRAGEALGYAFITSIVGSLIGVLVLILLAQPVSAIALKFSAPEYFAIAIFGLTMIISVSSKDLTKGIIAGLAGFFLATIGLDPVTGVQRFTTGSVNLLNGFSFIPVLIGLFAVSEALYQATKVAEPNPQIEKVKSIIPKLSSIIKYRWLLLKSSVIGAFIGVLPGAGGDIASIVSYSEAKRSSKEPEKFGNGAIEGVIASETANNACVGGVLIPLLTLGIPGDAVSAILLGAMRMHDLRPGPLLFEYNIVEVYGMYAALIIAIIMIRVVGIFILPYFAKVMAVPKRLLVPTILLFSFIGAYAISNSLFDSFTTLGFGVFGFVMLRFGFPVAPLVLALILGPLAEDKLRQALVMSKGSWMIFVEHKIALVILILAAVSLIFTVRRQRKGKELVDI